MKTRLIIIALFLVVSIFSPGFAQAQQSQEKFAEQGMLKTGESQQRTLAPDTTHVWNLALEKNHYIVVEVEQKGIDVVVRVVDPNGTRTKEIDSPTGTSGTEKANWIANRAGVWKAEIVPLEAKQPGDYEIKWQIAREATENDRKIVEADSLSYLAELYLDQNNYNNAEQLFKHLLVIQEKVLGPEHLDLANSLNSLAVLYINQGKYNEAESLFNRSLIIREKKLGPQHPDVATSLNNLATSYNYQGKHNKAEPLYKRSLAIREKTLGPQHPKVAIGLNNIAEFYRKQGKYEEAEPLYKRSLAILEKTLGSKHPRIGMTLGNIAGFYQDQGKYNEAESFYKHATAILEDVLGPEHSQVATSLNNLAGLYTIQGKYNAAEPLLKRSLAIQTKSLGLEHPHIATFLNNFAVFYQDQGKYNDAELFYKRALGIREKVFGPEHTEFANSLNNLAGFYYDQGKYDEAESLFSRAMVIREKVLGAGHIDFAMSLNSLAVLYRSQGKYDKVAPFFMRALRIFEKSLGREHPQVATCLNNLAMFYKDRGKYNVAEPLFKRSLDIFEKTLGPEHPNVATSLNNLALFYQDQGKYDLAELLLKRSSTIKEKIFGHEHPSIALGYNNLANLYVIQEKYNKAEPLYMHSLNIMEKVHGSQHLHVAANLNNFATLYLYQDKYDEALPLYKRSLAIREKTLGLKHPDVAESLINYAQNIILRNQAGHDTVLPLINRAIQILDITTTHPKFRIHSYSLRAQIHKQGGDLTAALTELSTALRFADKLLPQVGGGEETRAVFFGRYADSFNRMVSWQLEAGEIEKALEYAERGRARVLLDQLAASKIDIRSSLPDSLNLELTARESDAKARMSEYQKRLEVLEKRKDLGEEEQNEQIAELKNELNKAYNDYQQVYEEMKLHSPLWQNVITSGGEPVSLDIIQKDLIPGEGLMLVYQIGKEGSFLFVIPPEGRQTEVLSLQVTNKIATELEVEVGPLTSAMLDNILVGRDSTQAGLGLVQWLSRRPKGNEAIDQLQLMNRKLHALRQILIPDTLWPRIAVCTEVILIPDGALHLLPFDALVVEGGKTIKDTRYWLDDGPVIRYAPSATTLYNIEQRVSEKFMPVSDEPFVLTLYDPIYDLSKVTAGQQKTSPEKPAVSSKTQEAQGESILDELLRAGARESYARYGDKLSCSTPNRSPPSTAYAKRFFPPGAWTG